MENKIKEIQEYFKKKILSKDFSMVKVDAFTAEIVVDEKYYFHLWVGNFLLPCTVNTKNGVMYNQFMALDFSVEESEIIHSLIKEDVLFYKKEKELIELQDMLNKKKSEYDILFKQIS